MKEIFKYPHDHGSINGCEWLPYFLCPLYIFKFVIRFFHCLFNKIFSKLNTSSIGAKDGVYRGIKATLAPDHSKISITTLVLLILELSRIINLSDSSFSRSNLTHNNYFSRKSPKVSKLFLVVNGDTIHSPIDEIAIIIVFDPLYHMFNSWFDRSFSSQE